MNGANTHSIIVGYILWAFGFFGLHRFYYGRQITGIIWALTLGLLFVGWIVDFFLIPGHGSGVQPPLPHRPAELLDRLDPSAHSAYRHHRPASLLHGQMDHRAHLLAADVQPVRPGFIYDLLSLNEQVDEINGQYLIEGRM